MSIRVLVACEESQAVCIELRKMGIQAFSNDTKPCSGGHPEWHIQKSVFEIINDGWHCMIAFPPCTHIAVSGAAWFEQKRKDGRQQEGIDFFMAMVNAPIKHIAVENPVGIMSKLYKPPTQVIHPYYFGDEASKKTCLWLKNLPPLYHNDRPNLFDQNVTHVSKGEFFEWVDGKTGKTKKMPLWYAQAKGFGGKSVDHHSTTRSKTFQSVAAAMGQQWGSYLIETYK